MKMPGQFSVTINTFVPRCEQVVSAGADIQTTLKLVFTLHPRMTV